jgi:multisubunit Na+/H+ antiporter MnhF subunit
MLMQLIIYHIVNGNHYVDKIVLCQSLVKNIIVMSEFVRIYSKNFLHCCQLVIKFIQSLKY